MPTDFQSWFERQTGFAPHDWQRRLGESRDYRNRQRLTRRTRGRRGSVFGVSDAGIAKLVEGAAENDWLGERTYEGFGRFRLDAVLPGVTGESRVNGAGTTADTDIEEEAIAAKTQEWFNAHKSLAGPGGGNDRNPSLSQ